MALWTFSQLTCSPSLRHVHGRPCERNTLLPTLPTTVLLSDMRQPRGGKPDRYLSKVSTTTRRVGVLAVARSVAGRYSSSLHRVPCPRPAPRPCLRRGRTPPCSSTASFATQHLPKSTQRFTGYFLSEKLTRFSIAKVASLRRDIHATVVALSKQLASRELRGSPRPPKFRGPYLFSLARRCSAPPRCPGSRLSSFLLSSLLCSSHSPPG